MILHQSSISYRSFVWRIAPYTCLVVALISAGSLIKVQLARTRNVTERNNPSTGVAWPYIAFTDRRFSHNRG